MAESKEDTSPDIAGIVRNPLDEIKAIRHLLADVYKDAGDGRTLFRELVQNADDACARRLTLTVLEGGWRDAKNSLLRGPALLVANDGPFPTKDREAVHKAIGGAKEGDVAKIGTFGIGLKSVFHICEAFLYIGAAQSEWRPGVLNPWYGTGDYGNADPLFPDWDKVGEDDRRRLRGVVKQLLGETDDGLLLWIPLRLSEHDRGVDGRRFWLADRRPRSQELCSWFDCSKPAALLLAQCGHLQAIDARRAENPKTLGDSVTLMSVARPAEKWLGRYREESSRFLERSFGGEIESRASTWSVVGIESLDGKSLRNLRSHPDWPQSTASWNGRYATVPRKALAHAAVTVLRPVERDVNPQGMRMRWAVFLPLDDDPAPRASAIVASDGPSPAWEIILHGYFWPSHDRRSIPGITDEEGDTPSDGKMRDRWNRRLCEELLLPLLPRTLAKAVEGVDERTAHGLLERVVRSDIFKNRMRSVTQRHWLLPVVAENRVHWKAMAAGDAGAGQVLSIPNWDEAPEGVRPAFLASCREAAGGVVFIEDVAPRFSGELDVWTVDYLERLLNSVPVDALASIESLKWLAEVVRHVLAPDARREDIRTAFVRWLARRIGEGALALAVRWSVSLETRNELREAWRGLCAVIPSAWLVETRVATRQAVEELTKCNGVIGKGLFLLPIGHRRSESQPTLSRDNERLDRALTALGERLHTGGESERLRRSRLLLAETLLLIRPECPMDDGLRRLPFLRAIRLPEDKDEAWSVANLRCQIENHRAFARPTSEAPEGISDPKAAVAELAMALDEPVWLVNSDAVAFAAFDVPTPESENLASAVLQAGGFAEPGSRTPLLLRLVSNISGNANVRLAARALLAGRAADVVGDRAALFLTGGGRHRELRILLRLLGQSWRAVDTQLVGSLSHDILEDLSVGQADLEALHRLLDECLNSQADWTSLIDEEAQHLLESLHSADPEGQARWRRMPLHRGVEGDRGAFDDRALCSTRSTGDIELPDDLLAGVRLLDPDSVVAHLYTDVPKLDRDGVLQLMLRHSRPWVFAQQILQHMRSAGGPVGLPPDLRRLMRVSGWLPDRDGRGLAPDTVLIAPGEVLDAVHDLAAHRAFGEKRLPDAIDQEIWPMAEGVVREVLGRMRRGRQVERMVDALVANEVAQVGGGVWLVMPEPRLVKDSLIACALETTLAGVHPGWKLVYIVNQVLGDGGGQLLVSLTKSLCAPVPPEHQIEMLTQLAASRPAKNSPDGRMFRRLLDCFTGTSGFFEDVLPTLHLPTQDGNWHASRDVARTEIGVARRHRLIPELRPILRLNDDDQPLPTSLVREHRNESVLEPLRSYFEPWRNQVKPGAVGAFLSLLGSGWRGEIESLAEEWLGEDLSIEDMRSESKLVGADGEDPCLNVRVRVSSRVARGDRVHAVNVVGELVEMAAEPDADTLFAVDPEWDPGAMWGKQPRGPSWMITLRDVDPQNRSSSELEELLGGTTEKWATKCLKLDRERAKDWWAKWGKSSAADLNPVLASITANLPLTLRQLDVHSEPPLRDALRAAERAQRKREQAPSQQTIRIERESLDRLANLIGAREHQEFLWKRVNELMHRYGYRSDGVLLELAQNADDALAQAAEITGGSLPHSTRRFCVRVHEVGGTPTVDVMHWGRPINDAGGAAFPAGRDRQWDQDLYFMMLMNLSGKPGEAPGERSASATTGRFGLGFKSVHLISSSPSVVSGFIAFSIAGGLLPMKQAVPADADSWMIEGRRATLVRMPLRRDADASKLIQALFGRFSYALALLPVFARQVREVVVKGGPFRGVHGHVFDGKQIEGASAWSVGTETELPNHPGRWRVLRFRPSDSGRETMGTAALALGLQVQQDDRLPVGEDEDAEVRCVPAAFLRNVPFLWNVTPTREEWACGYIVNGPFKLHPGRTRVSLDDATTLQAVGDLGDELGSGLIELHDVLTGATASTHGPMLGGDGQSFLSSLWEVLASGTDQGDSLRQEFLLHLHGKDRGVSAWMAARPVVPTRLPAPFPPLLPPLRSGVSWEVATEGLDDPNLCAALAEIDDEDLRSLVAGRRIVSDATNRRLVPLCALAGPDGDPIRPSTVRPADLLAELAEKWDYLLTPTRLHALRPLSEAAAWDLVANDPHNVAWRTKLRARSADGSEEPLRRLLLQEVSALQDGADGDHDDELLRSAFAPSNRILDPAYIGCREDWTVFRWLRVQHRIDAAEIADWYMDVRKDLRPAALHYLLDGELQDSVLRHLISLRTCPSWLRDFAGVSPIARRDLRRSLASPETSGSPLSRAVRVRAAATAGADRL